MMAAVDEVMHGEQMEGHVRKEWERGMERRRSLFFISRKVACFVDDGSRRRLLLQMDEHNK